MLSLGSMLLPTWKGTMYGVQLESSSWILDPCVPPQHCHFSWPLLKLLPISDIFLIVKTTFLFYLKIIYSIFMIISYCFHINVINHLYFLDKFFTARCHIENNLNEIQHRKLIHLNLQNSAAWWLRGCLINKDYHQLSLKFILDYSSLNYYILSWCERWIS